MVSNASCEQTGQVEKKAPSAVVVSEKQDVITASPAPSASGENAADVVYLKVQSASVSGFDEYPDWAPKPDAMAPFDGNMETRWASAYQDNQWIVFDFGKPRTMSKLILKWEQAYSPKYEIAVSDDAENWKQLVLMENQTGGVNEIVFPPVTCRYVKLTGISRVNPEWGISIWEIEPYGTAAANPGDVPIQEAFKAAKEKTEAEKKVDVVRAELKADSVIPSPGPVTLTEFQKGVNYTSWDRDELSEEMSDYSLAYLSSIGVTHIALMVVNYQEGAEMNKIYVDPKKTISDEALIHSINMIHALGMKVMLKPHVDLADEEARSNIIPSDEWFANYKTFIMHYADIAAKYNVELFCIGTELSNTTIIRWKDKWLDIINDIRKVYKGPLTYAANWDEYDTVSFWNEIEFIGMDAYFPLTDKVNPTKEELIAGWNKNADKLEAWLKEANLLNKPVIFTEVGYDTIEGSNKQPWRILPTLSKFAESQDEQANCLEALFVSLSNRSWFKGFYWWNYFPRPDIGPLGYTLRGKKGEKILTEWFSKLK